MFEYSVFFLFSFINRYLFTVKKYIPKLQNVLGIRDYDKLSENVQNILQNTLQKLKEKEPTDRSDRKRSASQISDSSLRLNGQEKSNFCKRRRVVEPYYFLNKKSPCNTEPTILEEDNGNNNDENTATDNNLSPSDSSSVDENLSEQNFCENNKFAANPDQLRDLENENENARNSAFCAATLPVYI